MRQIGSYTLFEQTKDVLRLDDGLGSSFYLVIGRDASLLIDTGMAEQPLRPVIEQLTDTPVTLLITHGHGDHMRHMTEFDTVYMHSDDLNTLPAALARMGYALSGSLDKVLPLEDGHTLQAGNLCVRTIAVGGHSPGSMVFYEDSHHLLFTGDAVGSGCGVWMQLANCLPLSEYRSNLLHLDAARPDSPTVLPGHYDQRTMHPSGNNPVCQALVRDMITLCTLILEHKECREAAPEAFVREYAPAYQAQYGRASMIYTETVIC